MHEYWQKVHDEALAGMRKVLDGYMKVEDTCESMHKALTYVMKHGNGQEKADAIAYFNDYKWAAKEMTKEFTAGCPTRIMFDTFTRLADASPALAVSMALVKYPSIAPIVSTVKDAQTFDVAWNALTESVEANGFLPFDVKEVPFGPIRTFKIRKTNLDAIRAEMERAYKEEVVAAKAVVSAGESAAAVAK